MEAEFISLCLCYEAVKYSIEMLKFLRVKVERSVVIFCDNQSAITAFKHKTPTKKSKHIDIRYHKVKNSR